jgi:hypothetical protein
VCLLVLLLIHGRHIPRRLTIPEVNPRSMLCDTPGAIFGTVNVLGCLGLLAAAPTLNWPLWAVTLACAGLHLSYNFMAYVVLQRGLPAALEARRSSSGDGSLQKPKGTSSQVRTRVLSCKVYVLPSTTTVSHHSGVHVLSAAAFSALWQHSMARLPLCMASRCLSCGLGHPLLPTHPLYTHAHTSMPMHGGCHTCAHCGAAQPACQFWNSEPHSHA